MIYARPQTLGEAVKILAGLDALVLNGGTDVFPAHVGKPLTRDIVDISKIAELRGIREEAGRYRIGGGTTWTDILHARLPPAFDALKQAAREVGSVQIQNRGTIAGNLCNASPAADGVPPLLVLNAKVELTSLERIRLMPLEDFITGNRRTALARGEVLSAIVIPKSSDGGRSSFVKHGARRYLVISIVMVAALLRRDASGCIADARVAVGAASAVAQRMRGLEKDLVGLPAGQHPSAILNAGHAVGLTPIDDVRATAAYRNDAAVWLIGRALDGAAGVAAGV